MEFKINSLAVFFLTLAVATGCGSDNGPSFGDSDITPSEVETIDLGFGNLSVSNFNLYGDKPNAREVYQLTHYIGRTHGENDEDKIHIPIRSYVATCATDTAEPRMFVSVSIAESEEPGAETYGSVYELRYDPQTNGFQPTENRAVLGTCYETHGITASADCSRVAVLCNVPYKESERTSVDKDIVAEHGTNWMQAEDNHDVANDNNRKENDQIWLYEWNDDQPLSDAPAAYVVSKMHGGTHLAAQELIYVDDDSQGRASYGFSVSARVFDGGGGSHYSANLTIVHRNDWSMDMNDGRGWDWACGNGHVANIRAFYNPGNELYGAICTSDWNDWFGNTHGQLGTIAIKMEDRSSISEGRSLAFVPSNSTMTTNGGGHKVLPVDADTNLVVTVGPKLIADEDMDRFLTDEIGVDIAQPGPFDQECADYDVYNCFMSYLVYGDADEFPSIPQQGLMGDSVLEARSLSRIGIAKVDGNGSIEGHGFNWLVADPDCQVSDPQLVDLQNGRYLLGYARFQCVSEGEGYQRVGNRRSIIPKSFPLMEIDVDGNILAGPMDIGNHGWGGLDDIQVVAPGQAAWVYVPTPTLDTADSPMHSRWNAYLYQSATP